jgi:hypothetical protein
VARDATLAGVTREPARRSRGTAVELTTVMRNHLLAAAVVVTAFGSSARADDIKDPVKCMIVRVGGKDLSPPIEVDWLKGQPRPDKIPPKSAEILCTSQAHKPALEWAKAHRDEACDRPSPKVVIEWGRISNPKRIETDIGGLYCKSKHR